MPARCFATRSLLVLLPVLGVSWVSPALAQQPTGLIVVAHGAGPEWNESVRETVRQVRWQGPVEVAFLMGPESHSAGWDSALTRVSRAGVARLVVVPLMVSSFGSHYRQILHYAGQLDSMPTELASHNHHGLKPTIPVIVTAALDGAPEIAQVLHTRRQSWTDADRGRAIVLLGHGPGGAEDTRRWMDQLDAVGAALSADSSAPLVRSALLQDDAAAPVRAAAIAAMRDTVNALAARSADSVLVVPVMIAGGVLTRRTIPADIQGLPVRYHPVGLTPHPAIASWIERVARAASPVETGAGLR